MSQKTILSYGTMRGLSRCSNDRNVFTILALDHRGVLKKPLGGADDAQTFANIANFKREVVTSLSPHSSAVLLDPAYGVGPSIANATLPGDTGLVVTLEESGHAGTKSARVSRVGEGWGVDKIKRVGACAVKLLLYYHPEASTAPQMRDVLSQVAEDCRRYDIPLFLETLVYSIDPAQPKLSSSEMRELVVESARQLTPLGGDIYKAEFPLNVTESTDESDWVAACKELTAASRIPWLLLSAGVNFETFARQTRVACRSGASGILAGRAIWQEAPDLPEAKRREFLSTVACDRILQLAEICNAEARPWTEAYQGPATAETWYREYANFDV